jgi:phosphoribosylglycinamide formyltransferase-1
LTKRLLFLASGRGSNFQAFVDHIQLGVLKNLSIAGLVCNQKGAPVVERGKKAEVETTEIEGISRKKFPSTIEREQARQAFDKKCLEIVVSHDVDYVVLAGFDQIVSKMFVEQCPFRIINIHPAYNLRKFGGKNMVGSKVHEAVVSSGEAYSGCTVHFVSGEVDQGPAILKRKVPVLSGDTPLRLEERILSEEHLAYPEALQLLVDERVFVSSSGTSCFVDRYSDNWDIEWFARQSIYINSQSNSKEAA